MVPSLHFLLTMMSAAYTGVIAASRASSPAVIVFNIVVIHLFWACSSVRYVQHRKASFRCLVGLLLPRAGFAARRQTFVRRCQNCGVGLWSSGGWQMRRATA